ncbi:MAG: hypothetical protein HY328_17605 [Chloroflexi bacterium]|nr:hypothetical protein [Chloroflexota bacterium]
MTRYTFGFSRDIAIPFPDAVSATAAALQAEGFHVTQLGEPEAYANGKAAQPAYAILDACDPALLKHSISTRPDLSLMTTCRAVICSNGTGATLCISDPYQTLGKSAQTPSLAGIVQELNGRLWSAYLRVVLAAAEL